MATLRNKRKLAAVSRETPEGSRGSRGRNVLDSELSQDHISQVSKEIEWRVTKKLSKDFNKTESGFLAALAKLDEFLLNPQFRNCSVAAHGTSRNSNSENRETQGDRSSNNPYPEVGYFLDHSGQFNSPEAETISYMVTETYPHRHPGLKYWPKFLRFKGVNGGQNYPQKPLLPGKIAALTAFNRKNSSSNGVQPEK